MQMYAKRLQSEFVGLAVEAGNENDIGELLESWAQPLKNEHLKGYSS